MIIETTIYHKKFSIPLQSENVETAILSCLSEISEWLGKNNCNKERIGIYLSTLTAGMNESVSFWKEALEKTPSFVNPAIFPWTLPNAPAAYMAQVLKITGPVFTFLLPADSEEMELNTQIDFMNDRIDFALIANLEIEKYQLYLQLELIRK